MGNEYLSILTVLRGALRGIVWLDEKWIYFGVYARGWTAAYIGDFEFDGSVVHFLFEGVVV